MRKFSFLTQAMGPMEVVAVFSVEGVWEGHETLQELIGEVASYFGVVDEGVWNHAKAGYTDPLVQGLGVPPEIVLRRITPEVSRCHFTRGCPKVHQDCHIGSGAVPECFMADGPDPETRSQLHQMVWAMLEGSFVVIVRRGLSVV